MSSKCWRNCRYEHEKYQGKNRNRKKVSQKGEKINQRLRLQKELRGVQKMSDSIVIALITSAVTLFGVILSNSKTAAVTTNEIKHLAEEVQIHHEAVSRSERYVPYGTTLQGVCQWLKSRLRN